MSSHPSLEILERQPASDQGLAPLLFVHGLGHGAWCWEHWLDAAAEAGHPAYAVSLRGHAGSGGRLRTARLSDYVDDVVRTAESLPGRPVLVGHSMGGLVVQKALARYAAPAAVLVATVPSRPALGSLALIARQHPGDAARVLVGGSLPMRAEYLFTDLPATEARRHTERCGPESPLAQFQLLLHRAAKPALGAPPVLVLGTPDDRLVPLGDVRATARRYAASMLEFPGLGHDLMLDARWREPFDAMRSWLSAELS